MTTTARAVLSFESDTGMTAIVSVPRANVDLTAHAAQIAMHDMIDLGIVNTSNGMPILTKGAEIITTKRINIIPG